MKRPSRKNVPIKPHKGGRGKKHGGGNFVVSTTKEIEELAQKLRGTGLSNADIFELGVKRLIEDMKG